MQSAKSPSVDPRLGPLLENYLSDTKQIVGDLITWSLQYEDRYNVSLDDLRIKARRLASAIDVFMER